MLFKAGQAMKKHTAASAIGVEIFIGQ